MQATPPYDWRTDQKTMCQNCSKWLYPSQICSEIEKCGRWDRMSKLIGKIINKSKHY